jgi:hypothetical protein
VCGDMNISNFIDFLEARDPMVRLPEEYIFAARVSVRIYMYILYIYYIYKYAYVFMYIYMYVCMH